MCGRAIWRCRFPSNDSDYAPLYSKCMGDHTQLQREEQRILIIKPSSLGDIVHALPVLDALRTAHPHAYIAWLAAKPFAPLLQGHPLLDEVIVFDRARLAQMWRSPLAGTAFVRLVSALRRKRFDLVIDLQGLFRSGFLALASGAPIRVGFADGREFAPAFLTQPVVVDPTIRHAVDRNLEIARALNLPISAVRFPLGLRNAEFARARELLAEVGAGDASFIAAIPGARWKTKLWPAQRWATVIDELERKQNVRCVLLGAPADLPFVREIEAYLYSRPASLVGRTSLRELAALLAISDRVLCHDSGPMHIAAALGKPIVAIFGPTDPLRCGPYYERAGAAPRANAGPANLPSSRRWAIREFTPPETAARILSGNVPCSPCYRRECWHHSCMLRLSGDAVLHALTDLTASTADRSASHAAPE